MEWKIKSDTWGWLEASDVKITGQFVTLLGVTRDGRPFYPECMIPVNDAKLIIPPEA